MNTWTKQQLEAITCRNSNVLVSAAAGSGKTAVLVERIKQMIVQDDIDIDALLVVTFTNAAAGEMRQRISAAITNAIENEPENEEHLRKQMSMLNQASISTLHTFCLDVVRRYFYLINVDPQCKIADSVEADLMKQESVEEVFENFYEQGEEVFFNLVEIFGDSREDRSFQDLVLRIYTFMQSQPHPWVWLRECIDAFDVDWEAFAVSPWVVSLESQIQLQLNGARDLFERAFDICHLDEGPLAYETAILHDLQMVDGLNEALQNGLASFLETLTGTKHMTLKRIRDEVREDLKNECKSLRDEGKKTLAELQQMMGNRDLQGFHQDILRLYPYLDYLYGVIEAFAQKYHEKKSQKGLMDFDDMEHYALEILAYPEAADTYRRRFKYLFVDEYQDSNAVQESILNLIKREDNLFLVGDVKQSIYRFRQADPTLFLEKYYSFGKDRENRNYRIDLSQNFRSRAEILQGVNFLFRNMMSKDLGELEYNDEAALYPGLSQESLGPKQPIELCIMDKSSAKEESSGALGEPSVITGGHSPVGVCPPTLDPEELEELDDTALEARTAIEIIQQQMEKEIFDPALNHYRKTEYRDIVILMRATRYRAADFVDQMTDHDIPVYADVDTGFFDALEVTVFVNLLRIIDNRHQDIPLLSVMRSPLFGYAIDELIEVRMSNPTVGLFQAVESYMGGHDDELSKKLRAFAHSLDIWKEDASYLPIEELLARIFDETGYYHYVGAMPGGIQRQANLRLLLERARQFQTTSMKGLFNFIKFVDRIQNASSDMGMAKVLGENDNVVRIMSVHKSKGLEFPVVILTGLGRKFNLRDSGGNMLIHKELGLGPKYVDPVVRRTTETIARLSMKNKIRLENLSEEMRILYVAMTRPKEKLIMIGTVRDMGRSAAKWNHPLTPFSLSRGQSFLDWIATVVMRHPDGQILRDLAGNLLPDLIADESQWKVTLRHRSDLAEKKMAEMQTREAFHKKLVDFDPTAFSPEREEIDRRMDWTYQRSGERIPSKLSVSELKKRKQKQMDGFEYGMPDLKQKPRFLRTQERLSPNEIGTLVHLVMQHLDWHRTSGSQIQDQVAEMVQLEILTEAEAEVIDCRMITTFLESELGRRVLQSSRRFREIPFNLLLPAQELVESAETEEQMMIQGVIDLYFEEDQELVLVDYKTDAYNWTGEDAVRSRYEIQLKLYKRALEIIVELPVKQAYLYLFSTGQFIEIQ